MESRSTALSNEQIAHDLALLSVRAAMDGKSIPLSNDKSIFEEYQLRYNGFMEQLSKEKSQS